MYALAISPLPLKPVYLLLGFFVYAFIGWIWESTYVSIKNKKLTSSGFVFGPIIPIYGFAIMTVLLVLGPLAHNLVLLYVAGAVLVTVIEFVTSVLMEWIFHTRWWDYSDKPLNFHGRVALPVSLFWGVGVVVIVTFLDPIVAHWVTQIPDMAAVIIALVLTALFMFDFGFTVANALGLDAATKRISQAIEEAKATFAERSAEAAAASSTAVTPGTPATTNTWLERLTRDQGLVDQLPKLNFSQRRLLSSFPTLHVRDTSTPTKEIRTVVKTLKKRRRKTRKRNKN